MGESKVEIGTSQDNITTWAEKNGWLLYYSMTKGNKSELGFIAPNAETIVFCFVDKQFESFG